MTIENKNGSRGAVRAALVTAGLVVVLVAACPPQPRPDGPGRDDCAPANPPGVACTTDDHNFCQNEGGHRACAKTDMATVCCENLCRYTPVGGTDCPCVAGAGEPCQANGKSGNRTCVDQTTAGVERTAWSACVVPPDPPPQTYYFDRDGDSYCGESKLFPSDPGLPWKAACTTEPADCDNDSARNPGRAEVCGDGIDNDCTGGDLVCPPVVLTKYYRDADGDSYCGESQDLATNPGAPWVTTCRTEPASCENDVTRNPGKREICGNGKDDDCRGGDKECECSASAPVKCECSGGFVSTCMSTTMCFGHHPHCGGNPPLNETCGCVRR